MNEKEFIDFVLLNGYSLDKFNLMSGKMGNVLALFESYRKYQYPLAEEHAFNLLQEVLAASLKQYSFNEGKIGIACTLIYLIQNEYVEANYWDLYQNEHKEIVEYIKQIENNPLSVIASIDAMLFLIITKEYALTSNNNITFSVLKKKLDDYFSILPKDVFERKLFYNMSNCVILCYNLYKKEMGEWATVIEPLLSSLIKLEEEGYICTHFSLCVNLLQYALLEDRKEILLYADKTIQCYIQNSIVDSFDLSRAINFVYNVNKLQSLNKNINAKCLYLKKQTQDLLYDKNSYLYKSERLRLVSMREGIPRLLFVECLKDSNVDFVGHLIML